MNRVPMFLSIFLIVSLVLTGWVQIPLVYADSNTWQVGANSDDCSVFDSSHPPDATIYLNTWCRVGKWSGGAEWFALAARFTSITIPQGSTITSAYLKLNHSFGSRTGTTNAYLDGEDVDDAATFSTIGDYNGRARTTASADWTIPDGAVGTTATSSDIGAIIKEIVDRPGWVSGQDMVIFLNTYDTSTGDRIFYSYDDNNNYAPKLEVTWTTDGLQEYSEEFSENIGVSASLSRWRDVTFFYTETIVITESSSFTKELFFEVIEFTELIHVDADLYLILPTIPVEDEVSTFGTIALVIAIIALAIGIVAFTRRS